MFIESEKSWPAQLSHTASLTHRTPFPPAQPSQLKVFRANFQFKFPGFLSVYVKAVATFPPLTVVALFFLPLHLLLVSLRVLCRHTYSRQNADDRWWWGGLGIGLPWHGAKGSASLPECASQQRFPEALSVWFGSVGVFVYACAHVACFVVVVVVAVFCCCLGQ